MEGRGFGGLGDGGGFGGDDGGGFGGFGEGEGVEEVEPALLLAG